MELLLKKEMDALIQAKFFRNMEELKIEAFRSLLEMRPELKIESAIALYKEVDISFAKAAEICGLSQEELKEIMAKKGIYREVRDYLKEVVDKAEDLLLKSQKNRIDKQLGTIAP